MPVTFSALDTPRLAALLRGGSVGVLPTDTLYGLVARAADPAAVARLYALKQREQKPGTSIAATAEQLVELGLSEALVGRAARLWPRPVSVVIAHDLEHIHQTKGSSPFRVVASGPLRDLLLQTGPLVTSSANHPGQPPAINLEMARQYFGEQVDFYVDGGEVGERPPSTVVGLTDEGVTVFREGAVKFNNKGEII